MPVGYFLLALCDVLEIGEFFKAITLCVIAILNGQNKKRVSPAPYGALFHSVLLFYRNLSLKSIILWLFVMTIRFLILCLLLRKKYLVLDNAWFSFIFMREKSSMIFSDCFVAFFMIFSIVLAPFPWGDLSSHSMFFILRSGVFPAPGLMQVMLVSK